MALFVANATGNWSATATWAAVRNTPSIHATTNRTVTAGGITSATFTAPNTTNAVTGVAVYIAAVGTAGTLTATLRESGADTASTISVAVTSLKASGWVYLKLASPYTYTTTGAGAYAWKLSISGGSGTTSVADNGGATAFAYESADNLVSAVPTTNDDINIAGNNLAALVVTVDDTSRLVGSGTGTGTPSSRNVNAAINLSNNGALAWSSSANSTLECKGQIEVSVDGEVQMGTVASPISSSFIAKLITNQNGSSNNYDLSVEASGKWKMQGAERTFWKTTYVSGLGTAASPLVTADAVDWNVGDEFCITGQGSYDQHEKRFIITKNSSTSYVVSSTAGGAETALVYTHDSDDRIVLLTNNVVITSKTTTETWAFVNKATTDGNVDIDWARAEYCGGATTARRGFQLSVSSAAQVASADHFVNYLPNGWGTHDTSSTVVNTYTSLITYGNSTATNVLAIGGSDTRNKGYSDCFAIGNNAMGFYWPGCANIRTSNCEAWNNNANGQAAAGMRVNNAFTHTHNSFICQANRLRGIYIDGSANTVFNLLQSGNFGTNTIDIDVSSDTYNDVVFQSPILGSATIVNNYLNTVIGSQLKIARLDDTDWNHRWYTTGGIAYASGPDCSDTTTVQTDHHSVKLAGENLGTGQKWSYQILARAGNFVTAQGFVQMNSAFSGDSSASVVVELYLPGSITADATYTMPKNTNINPFNIGTTYSETIDGIATVIITAKTNTAAAYAYVGKLFNGSNPLTSIDVWNNGQPSQLIYPELGDPDSVWAVLTAGFTTSGTVGYLMTRLLTVAKFLGLK